MKTVITYTDVTDGKPLALVQPEFIYDVTEHQVNSNYPSKGQLRRVTVKYTVQLVSTHQIKYRKRSEYPNLSGINPDRDIIVAVWRGDIYLGAESEMYE